MNPACEFCDDVVGETADMSVGDAWLPGYVSDWRGTSVVVSTMDGGVVGETGSGVSMGVLHALKPAIISVKLIVNRNRPPRLICFTPFDHGDYL